MVGFTTVACEHGAKLVALDRGHRRSAATASDLEVETSRGPVSTHDRRECRRCVGSAKSRPWQESICRSSRCAACWFRRSLSTTSRTQIPMVIDMTNGFHFRPESLGFLLAWNDPEETPGFKTNFEPAFIEKILERAADRVPCFENLADQSQARLGRAVRDDARPPLHPRAGARGATASSAPTASAATA